MNNYVEMLERHQAERNEIEHIIAISEATLTQELKKYGWNKEDMRCVSECDVLGLYVHKDDYDNFQEMIYLHNNECAKNVKEDVTGKGFIYDMWNYELSNYEYALTGDFAPALEALGLTVEDLENNPAFKKGLELAHENQMKVYKEYIDNEEMER